MEQQIVDSGLSTNVTYVGVHFEKKVRLGEDDELVHYIRAGASVVAIDTEFRDDLDAKTGEKTRYLHRDHLGSVTVVTNEAGGVEERFSYDAHGKRRLTDWQAGTPVAAAETPRGFTGHEHLDAVGLIHMNGRVYDPTLGRFLSADPFVQAPETTQSFNRYSYVFNNPLSYTDPSGFDTEVEDPEPPGSDNGQNDDRGFLEKAWDAVVDFVTGEKLSEAAQQGIGQAIGERLKGVEGAELVGKAVGLAAPTVTAKGGSLYDVREVANIAVEVATGSASSTSNFAGSEEYEEYNAYAHEVLDGIEDYAGKSIADIGLEEGLNGAQVALDGLGMAPGVGIVADLINAVISGVRGNWVDFAWSLGAAIPVAGQVVTSLKWGKRVPGLVLLDSNVITELAKNPMLSGRILPGETPVVSFVTAPELRNAVSTGNLRGIPGALNDIPVTNMSGSLNTRINIRGELPSGRGRFGDGVIGAAAVDNGVPVVTNDRALRDVANSMGGTAR